MKSVLYCRRTFIAVLAIGCLTAIGLLKDVDVSLSIAGVAGALAAANASESFGRKKTHRGSTDD